MLFALRPSHAAARLGLIIVHGPRDEAVVIIAVEAQGDAGLDHHVLPATDENQVLIVVAAHQNQAAILVDLVIFTDAESCTFAAAHAASLRNVAAESEIDLRGMDTMEAVAATERFLDNAVMAKLEKVTIIHGKGTGALRAAVQQSLRKNKAVKSYRLGRYGEGESGVTVVELK